jgi:hypothetical protein
MSTKVVEHISGHVHPVDGNATIEIDVGVVEVNEAIHCSYMTKLDRRGPRVGRVTIYVTSCPETFAKG